MKREQFLKLTAGVLLAPYLAKIPAGKPQFVAPSVTEITLGGGSRFAAGDILRNIQSGEALLITKFDPETRVATVQRGLGTVVAQPIYPDDTIMLLGGAAAMGAAIEPRPTVTPTTVRA